METLGQTIKKIRKIKGFTQNEVYIGIISRSFASRFENGECDIAATKLFKILTNLAVSPSEFGFIHRHYQETKPQQVERDFEKAYSQHDLQRLSQIIAKYQDSPDFSLFQISAIGQLLLTAWSSEIVSLSPAAEKVWNRLMLSKNWTVSELEATSRLVLIADKKTGLHDLTTRLEENYHRYTQHGTDPFHVSDILINAHLLILQIYLDHHEIKPAKTIIKKAAVIPPKQLTWDGRITQQLVLGIGDAYFGDEKETDRRFDAIEALESLYYPAIDGSALAIIKARKKLAVEYRKHHGN